jgi:Co/Zn/Cd efflux system component
VIEPGEIEMDDHRHGHSHGRSHDHGHNHDGKHSHSHGIIDPSITTSDRGLWAVKWSFVGLAVTAALQLAVVFVSGSVALLADTIHNFGDAATAIPLAIAFWFARKRPSKRFSFGYGRVEDLAGGAIILTILASAIIAGYESIQRLLHPQDVSYLWAIVAASILGFLGNEAVAIFRIRIGREINSAALIADGYHARIDGVDQPGRPIRRVRRMAWLSAGRSDRRAAHHHRNFWNRHSEWKVDTYAHT